MFVTSSGCIITLSTNFRISFHRKSFVSDREKKIVATKKFRNFGAFLKVSGNHWPFVSLVLKPLTAEWRRRLAGRGSYPSLETFSKNFLRLLQASVGEKSQRQHLCRRRRDARVFRAITTLTTTSRLSSVSLLRLGDRQTSILQVF